MDKNFLHTLFQSHQGCTRCISPVQVAEFFNDLLGTLFPELSVFSFANEKEFELHVDALKLRLDQMLTRDSQQKGTSPDEVTERFVQAIPTLYEKLGKDVTAMYEGDPAAKSRAEVIRTYPGFYAIAAYRIAHELHRLGVQGIPRIITEQAHSKTGIDIHPGASIGEYFCIDHGTGIVIGETCIIGHHVKIYQGVTLGALSVNKNDALIKRHPTLEDHVVIYAGATILGGDTTVGHGSTIGGNVWLTRSVPSNSKVYYQARMSNGDHNESDLVVFKVD